MTSLSGFNAAEVEPAKEFEVLAKGWYRACIIDTAKKETRAGNGHYLELELEILSDVGQGRKLWDRLNLWNPSEKAVEIAKGTLSAICRAVKVLTPEDSSDLIGKPLKIKVVHETYEGKVKAVVNEYRADDEPGEAGGDDIPF